MSFYDIIKQPVISEKAYAGMERGVYSFWVDPKANKTQIKNAVQQAFGVRVVKVNTMNVEGKQKRVGKFQGYRADRKKAIVQLAEGQKIEALEGLV
ncbi:50S ribosomal protein L23 [Deinococcus yavapaiensis]|uniref:Large ribosomal subunit protein uL23 n=1 Tax=Deinococcus yavapaiensis KR-236 TaxID=694435 RepID=A0A318S017_9DEIO|nr:50S ribosomal protein L23 [Deinococcus yavapaiensis]PYE48116.1 LSU ribosomal protein L23P [Deinococcus yavapaiensis KR-236]